MDAVSDAEPSGSDCALPCVCWAYGPVHSAHAASRRAQTTHLASPHLTLLLSLTRSFISCMAVRSSESVCDTSLTLAPRLDSGPSADAWSWPLNARIGLGSSNLTVFGGKLGDGHSLLPMHGQLPPDLALRRSHRPWCSSHPTACRRQTGCSHTYTAVWVLYTEAQLAT